MQKENRRTVRTSVAHVGFAVVCLGVAVAGVIALVAVIFLLGTGTPYRGAETDLAAALLADMGWLGLFAVQHSGMARLAFKRRSAHFVPANLERFVYSAVSGALALLLPLWWQPLPGEPLWQLPLPFAAVALLAGVAMGIVALSLDPLGGVGFAELSKSGDQLRIVVGVIVDHSEVAPEPAMKPLVPIYARRRSLGSDQRQGAQRDGGSAGAVQAQPRAC